MFERAADAAELALRVGGELVGRLPGAVLAVFGLGARDLFTRKMPASITTMQLTVWGFLAVALLGAGMLLTSGGGKLPTGAQAGYIGGALAFGIAAYWALTAANRLGEIEGGFVVVEGGRVLAELALPVAGLMSLEPFEVVRAGLVDLRAAAASLGVVLEEPFLQLAFLALPVIPHLKITDFGMVDVDRFEVIP